MEDGLWEGPCHSGMGWSCKQTLGDWRQREQSLAVGTPISVHLWTSCLIPHLLPSPRGTPPPAFAALHPALQQVQYLLSPKVPLSFCPLANGNSQRGPAPEAPSVLRASCLAAQEEGGSRPGPRGQGQYLVKPEARDRAFAFRELIGVPL